DLDLNSRRKRSFTNIAPYIRTSYTIAGFSSISLDYSGSTVQPSLEQLQPLRKSSDLLNIQEGNPDLEPGFNHNVSLRYMGGNFKKEFMFMLMASGGLTNNAIINATTITEQNRRISRYVNVDGLPSITAGLNVNKGWRKTGFHIGGNLSYSRSGSYSIMNGQQFKSLNNSYSVGANARYELKELMEVSYMANVNLSDGNTQFPNQIKTRNFTHTHSVRLDIELPGKVFLQSDVQARFNPGNSSFANSVNVVTWDASVEKKFLANDQLVFKARVNDILNKNTGYSRTIDGANWNESNGFVLRRYFMFSVAWNFGGSL
ncbi:MAG: outer membrane beta-barrel protein, partial [Pseudobacter sp.]|uniref:outer membrane beta-barrel protein n=1 Tax=Pseudobacter sp. TaxID=2045420 RepID=UPI003F7FD88E